VSADFGTTAAGIANTVKRWPFTLPVDDAGGLRHEFMAWLPGGVVAQKLNGFIRAQRAAILEVSEEHVRLQVGKKGLIPWLGRNNVDFPMEVEFSIDRETPCTNDMTRVVLEIRPLVAKLHPQMLHDRYQRFLGDVRDFFMARDLERRFARRAGADFAVQIWPKLARNSEPDWTRSFEGQGLDISGTGLAFLVEGEIPTRNIYVEYYLPGSKGVVKSEAEIIHAEHCDAGHFYGAKLTTKDPKFDVQHGQATAAQGAARTDGSQLPR
jgi:hypothetical protein